MSCAILPQFKRVPGPVAPAPHSRHQHKGFVPFQHAPRGGAIAIARGQIYLREQGRDVTDLVGGEQGLSLRTGQKTFGWLTFGQHDLMTVEQQVDIGDLAPGAGGDTTTKQGITFSVTVLVDHVPFP